MSAFDDITKAIEKDIEKAVVVKPQTVATKGAGPTDDNGQPVMVAVGVKGTVASKPGTEHVTLDATTFQLMECVMNKTGRDKPRYTVVEKDKYPRYGNQYRNAAGFRAHIITRELYQLLLGVFKNTGKQIAELKAEVERANEQRDLYKLTVDALRKNGIID